MCWSSLITQGQQDALSWFITNIQKHAVMFIVLHNTAFYHAGCSTLNVMWVYPIKDAIVSHRHSPRSISWIFSISVLMKYSFLCVTFSKHIPASSREVFNREQQMRENHGNNPEWFFHRFSLPS